MKKLLLAAVAVVVLAAGPAVAADLGRKAPAYIPPPAPPTFTGCYVDGGVGYGLWNIDHSTLSNGQQTIQRAAKHNRNHIGRSRLALRRQECLLLAQSGHSDRPLECPLLGVKRTWFQL